MAHTPLHITGDEAQAEVRHAWTTSYSPEANRKAIDSISHEPLAYRMTHLISRIFFRGIYFPQTTTWAWLKLIAQNRKSILHLTRELFSQKPKPEEVVTQVDVAP
jgi:hypothetical protein